MNIKTKSSLSGASVIGLVLGLLLAFAGCKKEQAVTPSSSSEQAAATTQETTPAPTSDVAMTAEQTTCPVMEGSPINKALFAEYKGKKVYFCCQGCPERFLADPAQYVAKLPQFRE